MFAVKPCPPPRGALVELRFFRFFFVLELLELERLLEPPPLLVTLLWLFTKPIQVPGLPSAFHIREMALRSSPPFGALRFDVDARFEAFFWAFFFARFFEAFFFAFFFFFATIDLVTPETARVF